MATQNEVFREGETEKIRIDLSLIPDHVKDELSHATLVAVNEFLLQPGGREFLDKKKHLLRSKQ